ncbi:hypothetical protein KDU71_20710 [Carboxylicivirga sediminis]|uniref:Uncharacterized protein n=1 Tax=Carboxylicivirga sediminis TaxID=2006564 RepID=A0A941J087_9BACT|nr:hypothetical protein [Carboxylicivirga sediminis]MBR8538003.1 hypothetical protein [Carboxylicivirga sediminis]
MVHYINPNAGEDFQSVHLLTTYNIWQPIFLHNTDYKSALVLTCPLSKWSPLWLSEKKALCPYAGQAHPFLKKDVKTLLKEVIASHRHESVTPGFPFFKGRHSVTFIPITGFQYFETLFRVGLKKVHYVASLSP